MFSIFKYKNLQKFTNSRTDINYVECTNNAECPNSAVHIRIPASVNSIMDYAFLDNRNIKSVVISEGITSIGYGAFEGCENLESIVIPNSVENIGDFAFHRCRSLNLVKIPDRAIIGDGAFHSCNRLGSIMIPNNVTIHEHAFVEPWCDEYLYTAGRTMCNCNINDDSCFSRNNIQTSAAPAAPAPSSTSVSAPTTTNVSNQTPKKKNGCIIWYNCCSFNRILFFKNK